MSTKDPQPDWVRLEERAKAAFDQGNLLHARDLLVEASGAVGADSIVFSNLGLVSLGLEDYQGAIDAYSTLAEPDLQSRVNRGLAYERVGDVESARADYRAALLLDPDDVAALVNLGTLELEFGSDDAGRAVLEHAYALDPTTGWQLSDALRAAGDLDAAADVLRAAAEAGEPRAYLDLADVEHERGDLDASEAAFEAAIAAGVAEQADDDERAGS